MARNNRAYYLENRDRILAKAKDWYRKNKKQALARSKKWAADNPDKRNAQWKRYQVKSKYGLSLDEYERHIGKVCPICEVRRTTHLDHCHTTGKIRGGLCHQCNTALGHMADSPIRLRKAAQYLEAHANKKSQQQAGSNQPVVIAVG